MQLRALLSESELFYQQPFSPVTAGAESHMSQGSLYPPKFRTLAGWKINHRRWIKWPTGSQENLLLYSSYVAKTRGFSYSCGFSSISHLLTSYNFAKMWFHHSFLQTSTASLLTLRNKKGIAFSCKLIAFTYPGLYQTITATNKYLPRSMTNYYILLSVSWIYI